jgi:hypothetical protein
MLLDVGVSWEWTDDANRQPMALDHEELAEMITAWPLLSADLRPAILAIIRSADVMAGPLQTGQFPPVGRSSQDRSATSAIE